MSTCYQKVYLYVPQRRPPVPRHASEKGDSEYIEGFPRFSGAEYHPATELVDDSLCSYVYLAAQHLGGDKE
jgi:hypothetical protein